MIIETRRCKKLNAATEEDLIKQVEVFLNVSNDIVLVTFAQEWGGNLQHGNWLQGWYAVIVYTERRLEE